jgi:serine/threonine protein kinase
VSEEGKDLISKFLIVDPKKRLAGDAALKHPWFKKFSKM